MKIQQTALRISVSLFCLISNIFATSCFHCVSQDKQYNATVRRQLATQTDIFFYPIGVKSHYCSESIDPEDPHIIEGQICSKYSICVTLFPNLPDSTFVVRGCFENILRHSRRAEEQLQQDGCYLLRSLPMYSNTVSMDYVVCTCNGDYCNTMEMPEVVPKPYSFGKSNILKLSYTNEGNALQLSSSSFRISAFGVALIFLHCSIVILFNS
ncbi:Protein quiver [Caenorhabditis elegans]|uniref:Ly-6-related protein HOT-6 n=1 Tax=Caenorhabditis elegans TaxID=6239 RepID=G5EER8_CAEEL|nr:Protein quiver [Caenorhabditis elegans]AAK01419.1 Ly-6-related protein HOT-6 [Caenorhabditis elegans]CAA98420.1 Protein quiver [Caenorhabditis elegans]|eukprot:NP_505806.1 Homolog of Odr-2 (Two) [Caenorhabditis elegans]